MVKHMTMIVNDSRREFLLIIFPLVCDADKESTKQIVRTTAACRFQPIGYLLLSTSQTGSYLSVQTTGHSSLGARDHITKLC
jgi:hypothetical protein